MKQTTKFLIAAGSVGLVIVVYALWEFAGADSACFAGMIKRRPAMCVIALLACLGVGGFGAVLGLQQLRSYGAALLATAAILPGAAALSTVFIFLVPWEASVEGVYAPLWGSGIALLTWVVVALFCLRLADARHAIPSSYGELCQRLDLVKSQLDVVCPAQNVLGDPPKRMACNQIKTQIETIYVEFEQRGLSWALARGYINAWNRLHRIEEAMIEVAPQETVIAGALNDVLRLQGSQIDHNDDLSVRLRQAIEIIDPTVRKYLLGAAATPSPLVITTPSPLVDGYQGEPYSQALAATGGTPPLHWSVSQSKPPDELELSATGVLSGAPNSPTNGAAGFNVRVTDSANVTATKAFTLTINALPVPAAPPAPPVVLSSAASATAVTAGAGASCGDSAQARAVLRDVRGEINKFRDGRWNGLIVARNRLIATMMFTGMTAYSLLAIAIIRGAQQSAIAAASAFYLVGATIGLLNQLRGVSQSDTAVEDYGLSSARLITMPLFCGLAAIGGVVLMALPQMANPYSSITSPLAITTPSKLATGVFEQLYYQRIDAAGGTPPYSWTAGNVPLPDGLVLKTSGDLIAKLPKRPEPLQTLEPLKFTAQVKDSTGSSVEKYFFLNITSAAKSSAETQPAMAPATATSVRPLEDIFDLRKNLIGLLVAAVFGLTPGLLFDRLQQQSEKYKADLKSSEATQVKLQAK